MISTTVEAVMQGRWVVHIATLHFVLVSILNCLKLQTTMIPYIEVHLEQQIPVLPNSVCYFTEEYSPANAAITLACYSVSLENPFLHGMPPFQRRI